MRSAETSGVGGKGFGAPNGAIQIFTTLFRALATPFVRLADGLSPVSLAIGLTAITAAALSVAFDAARTAMETEARQREMMHVANAEPVALWRYAGATMTTLAGPADADDPFLGVMHRGVGAFAIALGVTAFAARRRKARAGGAYDGLLATIPFGVACWTADGRLLACNAQYRARLGGSGDIRPGTPYSLSVKRLVQGGYIQLVREDDYNRILELHREDGSCLMIDERPLSDGGFVTLVTDVTERRRTDNLLTTIREEQRQLARRYHEEKLKAEAASRAKTTFLAHLSHDIRTPLNHIIGFADLIRQQTYGPLGDRRYLSYVEDMRQAGERLLQFFASILELAELEGGQKPLRSEPFDMDEMLAATVRRFSGRAQRAGVTLTLGAPCGARFKGDRFALERMTGNIVENAVRFTPAGGRVTIAAYAATDGVVIEVTDTGIGMSAEQLDALSQPFAFGDAALTRQHSGTGLGVAIARAIAELSGGRLAIDSRPALGTTVAISLPLPAVEGAATRAA